MKKRIILAAAVVFILLSCVSCGNKPTGGNTDTPPTEGAEPGYKIADYYNEDGTFSALGLALDEVNGEKTLTVNGGDILTVGDHQYSVTAQSLTLSFYTQSSLDDVIRWWTDYCDSRVERGEFAEENTP